MAEFIKELIPYIMGPLGGFAITVFLLCSVLFGLWRGVEKWIAPGISKWFEKREEHIKDLMKSHEDDREAFTHAIDTLSDKLGIVDRKVDRLTEEVDSIRQNLRSN